MAERLSADGEWRYCSDPKCSVKIKNHRWGQTKADDWFFQKNGDSWCPQHVPDWVAGWRAQKASRSTMEVDEVDFTTPEGYDDTPDQGVHRYDGKGAFF